MYLRRVGGQNRDLFSVEAKTVVPHSFGFLLTVVCALTAYLLRQHGFPLSAALWGIAVILMVITLTKRALLGRVYLIWQALSRALSKLTTPIIFGAIYLILITPVALVMRMFGRDKLDLNPKKTSGTNWKVVTIRDENDDPFLDQF